MASTAQIYFFILFIVLSIIAVWWAIVGLKFNMKKSKEVTSYGLTGYAGDVVELSCPVGKKISIAKAKYVCTDLDSKGNPTCDYNQSNGMFMDAPNTKDAVADLSQFNGRQSASFTVPQVSLCSGCNKSAIIGIYDCKK